MKTPRALFLISCAALAFAASLSSSWSRSTSACARGSVLRWATRSRTQHFEAAEAIQRWRVGA